MAMTDLCALQVKGRRVRGGLHRAAEAPEIVSGTLRVSRGREDGALVVLQDGQPVADIGGVVSPIFELEPKVSAQEGGAQLGHEFFAGIAVVTEALAPEIAVEAGRMAGPVGRLMGERRVVGLRVAERFERWHLDVIQRGAVVGAVAAMPDVGAGRGEEGLGPGDPLVGIAAGVSQCMVVLGQALNLLDIEDRVGFQERDGPFGLVTGRLVGFGTAHRVGVDHGRALLALADVAAPFDGLLERHPDRRRVVRGHCRCPERQDVDAGIGLAVVAQGPGDMPRRVGGVPGLGPGFHALLKGFDDLVGDAAVDILPRGFVGGRHDLAPCVAGFPKDAGKEGRGIKPAGQALTRSRLLKAGVVRAGFDRPARPASTQRPRSRKPLRMGRWRPPDTHQRQLKSANHENTAPGSPEPTPASNAHGQIGQIDARRTSAKPLALRCHDRPGRLEQ
jgi:hypothetical protein